VAELELTRVPGVRRLYELQGVGTLRLGGWWSRTGTAESGDRTWTLTRRGMLRLVIEATDAAGTSAGEFRAGGRRRGGSASAALSQKASRANLKGSDSFRSL
jgi:hypothetical protein